jgi:hypothetical protein
MPPWLRSIVAIRGFGNAVGRHVKAFLGYLGLGRPELIPARFARSRRTRTLSLATALCAAVSGGALATDGDGAAIEGRWETSRKELVLDITRCAQGYCGHLVTPDDRCDQKVLTVAVKSPEPLDFVFVGDFAPPQADRPTYKVRVSVASSVEGRPARMVIIGDRVDPNPMRRSFPYRALLARVGEASCSARTTS